jgi:hypothetical protein
VSREWVVGLEGKRVRRIEEAYVRYRWKRWRLEVCQSSRMVRWLGGRWAVWLVWGSVIPVMASWMERARGRM